MIKKIGFYSILIAFVFISILSLVYLMELGFRVIAIPEDKFGKNGWQSDGEKYTWGHMVDNNELGFRDKEVVIPKSSDTFRIMVLGDSFTWGVGLNTSERYTNLLEGKLNKIIKGTTHIEVLNFGLQGGPTWQERDILKRYKGVVEPDLIVVGFCINDPQPKTMGYSVEREAFGLEYDELIKEYSEEIGSYGLQEISKKLAILVYRLAEVFAVIPTWPEALQRSYEKDSVNWKSFVTALADIKSMSNEMSLPAPIFMVLNHGTSTTRATNYNKPDQLLSIFLSWYDQAELAAISQGFQTANVSRELANGYVDIMAVNQMDDHPNRDLNEIYASKLADEILPILNHSLGARKKL